MAVPSVDNIINIIVTNENTTVTTDNIITNDTTI